MATISFTVKGTNGGATCSAVCYCDYNVSHSNTATTVQATRLRLGAANISGGSAMEQQYAQMAFANIMQGGLSLTFGGQTLFSGKTMNSESESINYSKSISKTTSQQTKELRFFATNTTSQYGTQNITVPALASCSVIYNANSGSGAPSSQTKYYNTALTLSSNKPTKSGYTFKGWATSTSRASGGTVDYAPGGTIAASVSVSSNINLYAVWELTYQKPEIHNLTVERCNQDGSDNDEGKYAKVSFDWSVFSSTAARYYGGSGTGPYANNSATCSITVGSVTATPTLSGSSGSVSGVIVGSGAYDVDTQYSVTVSVTDTQAIVSDHTTTAAGILSPSTFPMDFNADATAVGFFMPAPDNASGMFLSGDLYLDLPDYNASGTVDYDLYEAIVALGWEDDVLVD